MVTYLVVRGIVDVDDLLKTLDLCSLFGDSLGVGSSDETSDGATKLHGGAHGGER